MAESLLKSDCRSKLEHSFQFILQIKLFLHQNSAVHNCPGFIRNCVGTCSAFTIEHRSPYCIVEQWMAF